MCNILSLLVTLCVLGHSEGFLENGQTVSVSGSHDISNLLNLLVEEKTLRQKLEQRVEQMDKQLGILSERDCTCGNSGSPGGGSQLESLIQTVQTIQLNKDGTYTNITILQQDVKTIVDENFNLRYTVTELQKQNEVLKKNLTSVQQQSVNGTKNLEIMISSLTTENSMLQNQLKALQNTLEVYRDTNHNISSNLGSEILRLKIELLGLKSQYHNVSNLLSEFKNYQGNITSTIQQNLSMLENQKKTMNAQLLNVSTHVESLDVHFKELKHDKDLLITEAKNINATICMIHVINQRILKDSLHTQFAQLNQDKTVLSSNITDVLAKVKSLQQQQGQNTASIHDLGATTQTLQQQQTAVTQKLQTLTNNVKTVTDTLTSIRSPVGFTVRLTTGTYFSGRTYNPSETVPFSNVIKSLGGGFNSTDGVFYCPKSGTYLFEVTVSSYSAAASVNIVVNGHSLAYAYSSLNANNIYESGSVMQIVHLNKGDRVWIRSRGSYFIENYSYFSGVLITA